jgi:uncharacterized protein
MSAIVSPPFADLELAMRKVQIAEDLWNTRGAEMVAAVRFKFNHRVLFVRVA